MKNALILFSALFLMGLTSVKCLAQDEIYDTQRLPDGVQTAPYNFPKPTGAKGVTMRIEPLNWWVGMKNRQLEILVRIENIKSANLVLKAYPGVKVLKQETVENPNYRFVTLDIDPSAKPGKLLFEYRGKTQGKFEYELKKRKTNTPKINGPNSSDLIYLLMPDRFANGDPSNDVKPEMLQTGLDRKKMFFRHGGDIQGMIDHLGYLQDLGVTAIWPNPLMENDQPYETYHGYAVTDLYQIDRRFGSNELYKTFVDSCHKRGMKVIMDIIHNHIGFRHWFMDDIPTADWLSPWDTFTRTNYREMVLFDPHASEADKKLLTDGWFDRNMPDLNQRNPHVARYLIQNNIWWVEYSGHDGYRLDTYIYPDQQFMADWGKALQAEYPGLGMFGETWVQGPSNQAFFSQNNTTRPNFNTYMPGICDFQLNFAICEAFNKVQGWTDGITKVYMALSNDFMYEDPNRNVIFLDNHDMTRFYSTVKEDAQKLKSGLSWLLTCRGIPQIYYGTEISMKGVSDPDGKVRQDFPGGWPGDPRNKFEASGRSDYENEIFNHVRTLAQYRKSNPVLQTGKLMQFIPADGVYVYFRYDKKKTVMVAINSEGKDYSLPLGRFKERIGQAAQGMDILSGQKISLKEPLALKAFETRVIEVQP